MTTKIQSSASWTDPLKTRKKNLAELLKIVDIKSGKSTMVQTLTVNSIKAEMSHLERQLEGRQ